MLNMLQSQLPHPCCVLLCFCKFCHGHVPKLLPLFPGKSSGEAVDWMDSKGEEISLWQAMLDRPNCWIEGTLLLRLHMGQRK
jgi:hypothetical protein